MRVVIAGAGGREHALAWLLARSQAEPEIICAPGNGGTASLGENVAVAADDAAAVASLARRRGADLVVIGPDAAAASGVADACAAAGVAVFGPTAAAARIESSKVFGKTLMGEAGIPTARWRSARSDGRGVLMTFVHELGGRCAVKADGPALGKGVFVCDGPDDAGAALRACFDERRFGAAGGEVVVEERLEGPEASVLALCDGEHARLLPVARDYKRAFDGDRGPNTGGMGACSPPPDLDTDALLEEATARVIMPALAALRRRGTPFTGCLYAGLMLSEDGLRVLEFNARFGDPEAQVILPLLAEDGLDLLLACARGDLVPGRARGRDAAAVGIVAAAAGYPGRAEVGRVISGIDTLDQDVLCFQGGTRLAEDGTLLTAGGRVLTVVATAADPDAARRLAYANVERVSFEGMRVRADIALPLVGAAGAAG